MSYEIVWQQHAHARTHTTPFCVNIENIFLFAMRAQTTTARRVWKLFDADKIITDSAFDAEEPASKIETFNNKKSYFEHVDW